MLVPFAASADPACGSALGGLQLPNLRRLLARLVPAGGHEGLPTSLSPPHERELARAYGLPDTDGLVPLAAWQARHDGLAVGEEAWAWITPCHWRLGRDHVVMAHPQELQLDGDDSRALLAQMQPWFAEDGITLEYEAPTRWLARGEVFRGLPTASLDRVTGRVLDAWMPAGAAGKPIRRLQQEMQMLLYTLPLNEERQRGGLLPVNSFWVSGTGALPAGTPARAPAGLQVSNYLREAALAADWTAWAAAWQQLDARDGARLLKELEGGRPVRLTLCGEANSRSWSSEGANLWRRVTALLTRDPVSVILESL